MLGRSNSQELETLLAQAQRRIAELEGELERSGGRDAVTGLLTLPRFRAQLDIELQRARRHGRAVTLALLDVDGFRALNAHHGYAAGDAVLTAVGGALTQFTRSHDLCSRTGADEFVVLMPETDVESARGCFERILLELEATATDAVAAVSVSVGLAAFERGHSAAQLFGAAGGALGHARALGGGRVAVGAAPAGDREDTRHEAVEALAVTLLERDRYTGEHSESVVEMSAGVAGSLGLPEDEVARVRAAALLHDIGKVGVPDDILNKPGALDDDQWVVMREHPVIGERILRAIPGLGSVARIVRHEHERWDGGGYPDGLAGDEIPIGARIILACDAYHAMTSDRPYRAAMPHGEAVDELVRGAGSQFDPDVVETLVGYLYSRRQAGAVAA